MKTVYKETGDIRYKRVVFENRLYRIYTQMKNRCYNKNTDRFKDYGKRGILICHEWMSNFDTFVRWSLSNGYSEALSLDRRNNDKGYSPQNCRWTTHAVQSVNIKVIRRNNISGFKGVGLHNGRWRARINVDKKQIFLGHFESSKHAAIAYNNYIKLNNLNHTLNEV